MRTLILGLGNTILTDDAVGVLLARDLEAALGHLSDLEVIPECSLGGLDLIELIAGYEEVFIVDAIETSGGRPGDWHHLREGDLRNTRHLAGIHDCNLATALELGRRLGMSLPGPDRIHLIAVEIVDGATFGEELTPPMQRAFPRVLEEVTGLVATLPSVQT